MSLEELTAALEALTKRDAELEARIAALEAGGASGSTARQATPEELDTESRG